MRVNARIDDTAQEQLDYLTKTTGHSLSHVVREAVAVYHVQVKQQQPRPASRFLAMAGAWNSGGSQTASDVKAAVAEYVDQKHKQKRRRPPAPLAAQG
jgi:hypothetical protein